MFAQAIKKFSDTCIDLFFPSECVNCRISLKPGQRWLCIDCESKLVLLPHVKSETLLHKLNHSSNVFSSLTSLYVFEKENPVQELIHEAKYNHKFNIAFDYGIKLGKVLQDNNDKYQYDCILPVPIHKLKRYERGYNQSDYICRGIVNSFPLQNIKDGLIRNRYTQTQALLKGKERKQNVAQAFSIKRKELLADRKIILVDDVLTTGATLIECARTLKTAGVSEIHAAVIAAVL